LLNGLYDAKLDHQPVVAIVGQQARAALGGSYQQEVDLVTLFKDVASEYLEMIVTPQQVRHVIDRALRIARAERAPTCIIVPNDVQEMPSHAPARAHGTIHSGIGYAIARPIPDDRDHRLVIELCVVESVQQMDGARTRRRHAYADLAGELGMAAGHERRHLLVANLHELEFARGAVERTHDAVDAIARITVDARNAPFVKPREEKVADRCRHRVRPGRKAGCKRLYLAGASPQQRRCRRLASGWMRTHSRKFNERTAGMGRTVRRKPRRARCRIEDRVEAARV
jgi:hypothetical protein